MLRVTYDLVVIGGGAAGFFGAIQAAEKKKGLKVLILEKSPKLLSKVKVSGGGRCNVTHHCFEAIKLTHHYPRGEKALKQVFKKFQAKETVEWFSGKGVALKSEADGRMFPVTNDSQTIINCFLNEADRLKIDIKTGNGVVKILSENNHFNIVCQHGEAVAGKKILVAIGGHAKGDAYQFIEALGHTVSNPIPSLFTFNDSQKEFKDLMGIAVANAEIKIAGTKLSEQGPVLITHWGLSGPAVIKLSAWAAEHLHALNYQFTALVSWVGNVKEEEFRNELLAIKEQRTKQKILSNPLFALPQRLWQRLTQLAEIEEQKIWAELPQRNFNKLVESLIRCPFIIKGKTTFKDEFVTCGGVDLKEIDLDTMESKKVKNVFFAGEVLHIDGETGGFNFQAAWSTSYVAAENIVKS